MTLLLNGTERDAFGAAAGKPAAITDALLPQAFNNCQCECHRTPGVFHCVPCCPLTAGQELVHTG